MKPKQKPIINVHTHIFTINHVPNLFTRKIIPIFYKIFTIKFVKWYYKELTLRGNDKLRNRVHQLNKVKYFILDLLKKTYLLHWIYLFIRFLFKWVFNIVTHLVRIDYLFSKPMRLVIGRYLTMGRYSIKYKTQFKIFDLLRKTYSPDTKFVVLSMDMDYMGAGKPIVKFKEQIYELLKVKKRHTEQLLPFIAVDPRRIEEYRKDSGKNSFENFENYVIENLKNGNFSGIKLYPALGYYPFDKNMMTIYRFAQEYEIPIMTHCIEGSVYYRGKKQKEWNKHPILTYLKKKDEKPLNIPLPQTPNYKFTTNFTHPLNYHCLLNKELLSRYIKKDIPDLKNLKICIAHFGGSEQWEKYRNDNWKLYNNNISHASLEQYKTYYETYKNTLNHGSTRTIWWNASWLSVIYDLMIAYPNIYADTSFILHNEELFPLLKFMIQDPKVGHKILFGTDYYVVSHKKHEKVLYQNLQSYLTKEQFYKISVTNSQAFLKSKLMTEI